MNLEWWYGRRWQWRLAFCWIAFLVLTITVGLVVLTIVQWEIMSAVWFIVGIVGILALTIRSIDYLIVHSRD